MNKLYKEIILKNCKISKELLIPRMAMAITNPELVATLTFNENETFARVVGETLYSFSCRPVSVAGRITDECANEMPVT